MSLEEIKVQILNIAYCVFRRVSTYTQYGIRNNSKLHKVPRNLFNQCVRSL